MKVIPCKTNLIYAPWSFIYTRALDKENNLLHVILNKPEHNGLTYLLSCSDNPDYFDMASFHWLTGFCGKSITLPKIEVLDCIWYDLTCGTPPEQVLDKFRNIHKTDDPIYQRNNQRTRPIHISSDIIAPTDEDYIRIAYEFLAPSLTKEDYGTLVWMQKNMKKKAA